jgi:uncharacterized protein
VKRIEFTNPRGQKLVGMLHGELGDVLVISCHGMLSTKDGPKHVTLATQLAGRGIPTFRFDFAGRGESQGDLFDITYSGELEDLQAAIECFAQRGVQRFALFGSSMGGSVALLAAARDERIVCVATLAAIARTEDIEERYPESVRAWEQQGYIDTSEGKVGRQLYDDAMTHDVLSGVRILHAPLLVIHGEEDEVVPSADAHDIASTARNACLELVAGADHEFSQPDHLRAAMRQVSEFVTVNLAAR